jgi:hypothetical protein
MDDSVVVAIVAASGAVIVGLGGLAFNALWIGKHIDSLERRLTVVESDLKHFYREISEIRAHLKL